MSVRFNDLPLVVRERFVRIANARPRDPSIIAFQPTTSLRWLNYLGALVVGGGCVALASFIAENSKRTAPDLSNVKVLLILSVPFALFFAFVIGIVYGFVWKKPPYPEGHYAFPGAVVTTNGGYLRITPITQSGEPKVTHFYYGGAYKGSQVRLPLGVFFGITTREHAGEVANALLRAQQVYAHAWQNRDAATIQQMDPFHECSISNNWKGAPAEANSPPHAAVMPPAAMNGRWVAAAVLGVIFTTAMLAAFDPIFEDDRKAYDKAVKKMQKEQKEKEKKAKEGTDDDE